MKDREKMLGLMRFWLFGTFIIVLVATTVLMGSVPGMGGLAVFGLLRYWIGVLVASVLCVGWYYIYKWYLDKNA